MKKIIIICFGVALLLMSSCSKVENSDSLIQDKQNSNLISDRDMSLKNDNNTIEYIYDKNNNIVGHIERNGLISLIDDKIFYSNFSNDSNDEHTIKDFYLYDIDTEDNIKLGTINDYLYEASYDRILIRNHLYTIITTGDSNDKESRVFNILDFDLKNMSMDIIFSEQDSYIYNVMDSFDDNLLIVRKDSNGARIDEYNVENDSFRTMIEFEYDNKAQAGDTIRQLYYDEGVISVLRLNKEIGKDAALFLDKYDKNMNLLSSKDISSICGDDNDEITQNERRQIVFDFFSINELLYYENQSITRFLGKIEKNNISPLIEIKDEEFYSSRTLIKNTAYRLFCIPYIAGNAIYILNTDDFQIKKTSFNDTDDRYCIGSVFQYDNKIIIEMIDIEPNSEDERPTRLYYMNIDDLL